MRIVICTLNTKYIHSSLALRYLKAYLSIHGFSDVVLREYSINDLEDRILNGLYQEKADVVAFSCYIWNIEASLKMAASLKQLNPLARLVLGGPETSFQTGLTMEQHPYVDAIIRGEGEESLRQLLLAIQDSLPWSNIPGLVYRQDGQVQFGPCSQALNFELIPFPYDKSDLRGLQQRIVYYETSRGCPYSCSYCLSSIDRSMRFLSLERVLRDLDTLMEQPVREIKFVDRCFNIDEQRAQAIMDHIIARPRSSSFHFEIVAERMSQSFVDYLTTVPPGLFNLEIGVQSIHPEVLAAVNRFSDLERLQLNIDRLIAGRNMHIHLDLLAGLPFEDLPRLAASFDWVYGRRPDCIQLGFLKMLKGTAIRDIADRHGYIFKAHPPYEVLANDYLSHDDIIVLKDIENVVDRLYNSQIMPHVLSYIIKAVYSHCAFSFFRDMADYWNRNGGLQIGQRRDEYYNQVLKFIRSQHPEHALIINEWVRYDFLCRNCSLKLPGEIECINPEPRNQKLLEQWQASFQLQELAASLGFASLREARNHLHVHYFRIDPRSGERVETPLPVIFGYERHTRNFNACIYPA